MFRFTIRDVLWLTALVAMGGGWLVDHRHQQAARVAAEARSKALEAQEAEWREVNSWLTAALNKESSGYGPPGQWKPKPLRTAPDSR